MQIQKTTRQQGVAARPVPAQAKSASSAHEPGGSLAEFWRDYGINPQAMADRAFFSRPLPMNAHLNGGRLANPLVTGAVKDRLSGLFDKQSSLEELEKDLAAFAQDYGLKLNREKGVPQVNWDLDRPTELDFRHTGGPSAYHELVHVCQCLIGGAAALGTVAALKYLQAEGKSADSVEDLQPYLKSLSAEEKAQAMKDYVRPMEAQAYSRYEESAFEAAGFMGKKSKNNARYREKMKEVVAAFSKAYERASAPAVNTHLDAKIYGEIGHIARTNGETGLLLAGAGLAYHQLTRTAMAVNPLLGIPAAAPLGYLLVRSLVTG